MLFFIGPIAARGQFYNGHQMSFGKSRVQYDDFVWSFSRYENFDVYFNEDGKKLADYTADFTELILPKIEAFFDYSLDKRIQFIVYNRMTDFRQSNIGLVTGKDEYNIGGTTVINRNKAFLYFEGDLDQFDIQITAAITRMVLNEMLQGSALLANVANSTLTNIPRWYSEGLVAYLSKQWDIDTENKVRDGIISGKYKKFNRLLGDDAIYAGHAFWKYVADTYGESVIPGIIYMTSISKSIKTGFSNVLGLTLPELAIEWMGYYLNYFADEGNLSATPEGEKVIRKPRKGIIYHQVKISPSGNYLTYVTHDMGLYKIWLVNVKTGRKKCICKREYRLDQIPDHTYPVIAWHPSARYVCFFTEEQGRLKLYYYNIAEKHFTVRNFLYFDKVLDFAFNAQGSMFVFTGTRLGKTDIYVYDIASSTYRAITNDLADDHYPRFVENDQKIIFSSNRISDTLRYDNTKSRRGVTSDLFLYDFAKNSDVLTRLQSYSLIRKTYPNETDRNTYIELNDYQGVVNRYLSTFDSTISYVDTTIHYRYFAETAPLTNYARNILEQDYQAEHNKVAEVMFYEGRYHIYYHELDQNPILTEAVAPTLSQINRRRLLAVRDSLRATPKKIIPLQDVSNQTIISGKDTIELNGNNIDVNQYIFEVERINAYNEQLNPKGLEVVMDTAARKRPKIRFYQPVFYQNNMVTQVDFNFLNATYQKFTGGAYYFNPGMNVLLKVGANDLFEDFKIIGGVRLSPNLDANEYLLSFEDLTKRLDKQLIFHRQGYRENLYDRNYGTYYGEAKVRSHMLAAVLRYPFSQVKSFTTTLSYRNDRTVYLSSNPAFLDVPNEYSNWLGIKFEYNFDNTRSLGMNLYSGTRYKLFAEVHEELTKNISELVVFGADFRHYVRIHRSLIWANRFAWSSSQGSNRIIYYLGGVDNWINLAQGRTPTFIPTSEIRIDESQNYAFQAVGTNMRGFSQNIRNGNNFAVLNSEIRFPVFRYLANYPLSRSFFENFQVVGFFDLGSAWSGVTPWTSRNAYDYEVIARDTYTVTVDTNRDPLVAGYGFGVHSMLLGYFVRLDWAWGIENQQILPHVFYFSISLDF